jgi:hypothetical protein
MWVHVSAHLALRLDLELICGVLSLQGTDSGPQAHLRRGSEPTGGANIFFPCCFSKFCTLVFPCSSAALPTDAWQPTIYAGCYDAWSA